jgi:hypothetical protein
MKRMWLAIGIVAAFSTTARAEISDLLRSQLQQRGAKAAPGMDPMGAPVGGFVGSRQSVQKYVPMQAGHCYTVVGVGGQGVRDLDLSLYNPNNKKVASDLGFDATPVVQHCAQWPGAYRLEATVKRGGGEIAVQVYTPGGGSAPVAAPPATGAPGMPPPDPSLQPRQPPPSSGNAADALNLHLEAQARTLAPGATRVGDFFGGAGDKGQRSDWFVPLTAGECYTFLGAGGAGLERLSLYLWDPAGKRVADHRSTTAEAVMVYCAATSGPYHLQAKVEKGNGEYHVGVFAKKP